MEGETGSNTRLVHVPEDVVTEILAYLPAKSLMRFACVCKSWHHLIKTDLQFAMRNYALRTSSPSSVVDSAGYVFYRTSKGNICRYSFCTEAKTLRWPTRFQCVYNSPPQEPLRIFYHSNPCNGLICFRLCEGRAFDCHSTILLCNPSIREAMVLPPSSCRELRQLGLGFDPVNSDYKLVKITSPLQRNMAMSWVVDIYSVRSGRWRNLRNVTSPLDPIKFLMYGGLNANGRICNWLGYGGVSPMDRRGEKLISFDMVDEVLRDLPMPTCEHCHEHSLMSSSRWQACLGCFANSSIDIWVLHDVDQCMWSRQFSIKFPEQEVLRPIDIWMNDNELLVARENDNQVFHYDVGTQQIKPTGWRKPNESGIQYAESIVSIKGHMSSHYENMHGGEPDTTIEENKHGSEGSRNCSFFEAGRGYVHFYFNFELAIL